MKLVTAQLTSIPDPSILPPSSTSSLSSFSSNFSSFASDKQMHTSDSLDANELYTLNFGYVFSNYWF